MDGFGQRFQLLQRFPVSVREESNLRGGLISGRSSNLNELLPQKRHCKHAGRSDQHARSNQHTLSHDLPPHRIEPELARHGRWFAESFENSRANSCRIARSQ